MDSRVGLSEEVSGKSRPTGRTDPAYLLALAAQMTNAEVEDVMGPRQWAEAALARHLVTAWLRDQEKWSWERIASLFDRNQSTMRANYVNFTGKRRGTPDLDQLYRQFCHEAVRL